MNLKKTTAVSAFVLLSLCAAALAASLGVVCCKVGAFEKKHGCDVFANLSAAELFAKTNRPAKAVAAKAVAAEASARPERLSVERVDYDGRNVIEVFLSGTPDMDVVRNYVSVEPMAEGRIACRCATERDSRSGRTLAKLSVSGEFAFRTNVTLAIRKGWPLAGAAAAAGSALREDFVYSFRRKDRRPYVGFADAGRYLPPVGRRILAIEAMNVTNVTTEIRRVELVNIVQMLAREEKAYRNYYNWYEEGADAAELAGEAETNVFACAERPNAAQTVAFPVAMNDGKPANGVYLVKAGTNGDAPGACRVVCVSDLGLSVRRWDGGTMGVWVTSLTTGRPVPDAEVEVYSAARIKVMEGATDARGWCEPRRVEAGEPFAVVVTAAGGTDRTFLALRPSMQVDETPPDGTREGYLAENEACAFLWTDRGIYRHGETIFLHAVFRDGSRRAPRPLPVELRLLSPKGDVRATAKTETDGDGALCWEGFSVPDDQPGGTWTIRATLPGDARKRFGEVKVKIEEFAPPRIRVAVEDDPSRRFPDFGFAVSGVHLFGGSARGLAAEGAVVFEDVPFAPSGWDGWRFGNDALGLKPSFRRLAEKPTLDETGRATFGAPLPADSGLPKAAVRVTAQGTVFEDGGRPATARKSVVKHYYPYYIGSTLPGRVKAGGRRPVLTLACVTPDGRRVGERKKLAVTVERIDSFYSCRTDARGWATWTCERVRSPVAEAIAVETSDCGDAVCELPVEACGDYAVTVKDTAGEVSFGREFTLCDGGDGVVRAPLSDPTRVTLAPDKAFYRPGETPRIAVRSPFAGTALLSVMHAGRRYTEILTLANATDEIVLRPVSADDAPNLDVYVSVVQGVGAGAKHLAVRARGQTTVAVRPAENEIAVSLDGRVDIGENGTAVTVDLAAPGARTAVVTLVDEGIHLLTGGGSPDPVGFFARPRSADHPLYDLYGRLLPADGGDAPKKSGVKTGGGFGAEMFMRVSPVPTRRFRPLALWKAEVPVVDGRASVAFDLPEFAGEVRVSAIAYSATAAGAASTRLTVSPKLVAMPDAPRFAAPCDVFGVSLPVYNRGGEDTRFSFEVETNGVRVCAASGLALAEDASTNVVLSLRAPREPGELAIRFVARGFGEVHVSEIALPVRPAVAWRETAGVAKLAPGETFEPQEGGRFVWREYDSPLGDLARAVEWLADYPHGCLEQTVSRVFPLLSAGGVLAGLGAKTDVPCAEVVRAGVARVASMVRERGFSMWPDVDCAPWDEEVSLYAAHFLVAAEKAGEKVPAYAAARTLSFLERRAVSTNDAVGADALHTLALAGKPDKDRMLRLYDARDRLSLLSRARLAVAFAETGDRARARTLLANAASPSDVKEASFALAALLETDPSDARILPLVAYLRDRRDRARHAWGTTSENAHALLAIGGYYRFHPPAKGERFVAWRRLDLPDAAEAAAASNGLSVVRRLLTPEGKAVDPVALVCGDRIVSEIEIASADARELGDLVVEDLFAGAFEPIRGDEAPLPDWVMRSDARDDRMLVFSKRFSLPAGGKALFRHPLRVVSPGRYTLPGVSVEAMYQPALNARSAPGTVVVRRPENVL